MVPKLIGTKELENQQYIGQTPHTYVHIDMNLNFMHTLANLWQGGVSPIYWVKERKQAKEAIYSKYACSTQHKVDNTPKDKVSSDNKIPNEKLSLEGYQLKDTSRNEISIDTCQIKGNKKPIEGKQTRGI